jgi:hypothetical protein
MKYCAMCNIEKPYDQFNKANRKYGDGYNSYCRACSSHYYFSRKAMSQKSQMYIEHKKCRYCGIDYKISEFGKMKTTDDGYNEYCKICWRKTILKTL